MMPRCIALCFKSKKWFIPFIRCRRINTRPLPVCYAFKAVLFNTFKMFDNGHGHIKEQRLEGDDRDAKLFELRLLEAECRSVTLRASLTYRVLVGIYNQLAQFSFRLSWSPFPDLPQPHSPSPSVRFLARSLASPPRTARCPFHSCG